jgi:hydroxyacyl-ACP dehydratase HTD2-like protein with hotdog domain
VTAAPLASLLDGWQPEQAEQAEQAERIMPQPASALAGLLDQPSPVTAEGDPLPPLWHWAYLLERPAQRDLGPDGHPADGPFLPPIPHRRRMFAGGRMHYRAPLRIGDEITRRTALAGWTVKQGRAGELLFVTVQHTFTQGGDLLATEEQDLVYRSDPTGAQAPAAQAPAPAPQTPPAAPAGDWRIEACPDPVLLFRFSALTYNAHRIHYDTPYATTVEGHPGLVVHGPLLALLCLELPRRHAPGRAVTGLSFRARRPVYAGQRFTATGSAAGRACELAITTADGTQAMTATATFAP